MSKLLSGMQLYMSKHIVSSIANKDSPTPFDPRPYTPQPICIHACTFGGKDIALINFGMQCVNPGNPLYWATKLNEFDWQFTGVIEKFEYCLLFPNNPFDLTLVQPNFTTARELQQMHYVKLFTNVICRYAMEYWPNRYVLFTVPWSGTPGFGTSDDYPFEISVPWSSPCKGIFKTIVNSPLHVTHKVTDYELGIGTTFRCYWGVGSIPPGHIKIARDGNGNYTYQQTVP